MKICAYIPVGPLDSMGFQYLSDIVLRENSKYFDKLYVVSSYRGTKSLPYEADNIELISDERSWFPLQNGKELFTIKEYDDRHQFIFQLAREDGYDFLLHIHINQLIDKRNFEKLYKYAQDIYDLNKDYGYLYKSYLIGKKIMVPDRRLPYLINLHSKKTFCWGADSLWVNNHKLYIKAHRSKNVEYFIYDIDGLLTEEDSKNRWDFYTIHLYKYAKYPLIWDYEVECLDRYKKWKSKKIFKCSFDKKLHEEILSRYSKDSLYRRNRIKRELTNFIERAVKRIFRYFRI